MNTAFPEQGGSRVLGSLASDAPAQTTAAAVARPVPRERGAAWWLWPHVLSLDAPLVAVVWQHWWAHATAVKVLWFQDAILGLGVWMIYLADRLADTRQTAGEPPRTARHAFSARRRRILQPLLLCVALGLAFLTPAELPPRQFGAGLGLLLVAGGYFWLIHRHGPARWARWVSKEAIVGVIFAVGTTFFVDWRRPQPAGQLLGGAALFAALCFFNCALITQWEASSADRDEPGSLLNAFPWLNGRLGIGCLGLAALAVVLAMASGSALFWPIALGALVLAWLDHQRAVWSTDALRVLADLALLAPLVCGFWL